MNSSDWLATAIHLRTSQKEWERFSICINTLQVIWETKSFQSIICTVTDNQTREIKTQKNTE